LPRQVTAAPLLGAMTNQTPGRVLLEAIAAPPLGATAELRLLGFHQSRRSCWRGLQMYGSKERNSGVCSLILYDGYY